MYFIFQNDCFSVRRIILHNSILYNLPNMQIYMKALTLYRGQGAQVLLLLRPVYSRYALKLPGIEFVEVYKIVRSVYGKSTRTDPRSVTPDTQTISGSESQDLRTRYTWPFRPAVRREYLPRDKISEEPLQRFSDDLF